MKILVVDDDEPLLRTLKHRLEREGFEVETVATAADALSATGPFDAGIFDIGLGKDDGVAVGETLLDRGTVSRAIFFTGGAPAEAMQRATARGTLIRKGGRSFDDIVVALAASPDQKS